MDLSLDELLFRSSVVARKAALGNSLATVYSSLSSQKHVSKMHPLEMPPPPSLELSFATRLHANGLSVTLSDSTRASLVSPGTGNGGERSPLGSFHSPITARNPLLLHSPSLAGVGNTKGGGHRGKVATSKPHIETEVEVAAIRTRRSSLALGATTSLPISLVQDQRRGSIIGGGETISPDRIPSISLVQDQRRGSVIGGGEPTTLNRRGSITGRGAGGVMSPSSPDSRPSTLGNRPPSTPRIKYRLESSPTAELWYGSIVMLESLDGWFVTVNPSNGVVTVREPMDRAWEARRTLPFLPPKRSTTAAAAAATSSHQLITPIFHFRVTHLTDPSRLNSRVKWGDPVWLVCVDTVSRGMGGEREAASPISGDGAVGAVKPARPAPWKQGSVLGVQMLRGKGVVGLSESEAFDALGGGLLGTEGEGAVNRRRAEMVRRAAASEGGIQQHPPPEEGGEVGAPVPPSSLQALRTFITPMVSPLKVGGGGYGAHSFAHRPPPAAPTPVDPMDGISLGSIAGSGSGRGGVPHTTSSARVLLEGGDSVLAMALELGRAGKLLEADADVLEGGGGSKAFMRDLFNNQQALAKLNSSAKGSVNLGVRVPLNRLGVIHPIPAFVPSFTSSSFSILGSWDVNKGVLALDINGDGRVAEQFRSSGNEEEGGRVDSGRRKLHNVLPIGLGAFTFIDAKPSLTARPKVAVDPPPFSSSSHTNPYITNTSLLYLTQDALYMTCDRAQGAKISQQSGTVGGTFDPVPSPRPSTASTHHSSTTDHPSSPTGGGSESGRTSGAAPPVDALTSSSTSTDSHVYVTQASDGCMGGNRRDVYVMAEDMQAPYASQRDRRGVFQLRLLVKDGLVVADSDGFEGAVLAPRPPLGAPLDREWVLGKTQVSLNTSRALRLGAAALRVKKEAPSEGPGSSTTTPGQLLPGGLKPPPPVEHADYGDESAAANLVDLLTINADKAWRYTESKYLGHERLKAMQGGAVLAERRRTTQAPGLALSQHRKDRRAAEKNAFTSFVTVFPPQDDIDALVEATRRPPPTPRIAATAAHRPGQVCTLCGPMPPSYDGGSISQTNPDTSRRYNPANLCSALHEITRAVAAKKSRMGGPGGAAPAPGGAVSRVAAAPSTVRIPNTNIHVPESTMNWTNKPRALKAGNGAVRISNFDALLTVQDQGIGMKDLVAEAAALNKMLRTAADEKEEEESDCDGGEDDY